MAEETFNPQPDNALRAKMPLKEWFALRHRARTDLEFFAKHILGFKDVSLDVEPHRKMIAALQQFSGGEETKGDITLDNLRTGYKPHYELYSQPSIHPARRTLILVFRGSLKSTLATIAHKIQWSINYPNVRILLSSGTGNQVDLFMNQIVFHYRFNDVFRWLFPEHVPWGKVDRFGSSNGLITLARHKAGDIKEPTFRPSSIESAVAGGHYDVIDHDDVVNETQRTAEAVQGVVQHIRDTAPLLDRRGEQVGWTDFIGTRYDYSDAYGQILDTEKALPKERRQYVIVYVPAWRGNWGTDNVVATWPERLPISGLKQIEDDPMQGPYVLAPQYGLRPRPASSGLIESKRDIKYVPRQVINELYASLRLHVTIDLHGMAQQSAMNKHADTDYTAITLCGFARDGRCYVIECIHGRPNPLQVIYYMFDLWNRHPRIIDFKIQRDHMANTLLPFLQREQSRLQRFLPIVPIPVNNQISKKQKIMALGAWFRTGIILFADDLKPRYHIEEEIVRFPKFHDDILDTLRDQMENRQAGEVVGDVNVQPALPPDPRNPPGATPKFLGFGPGGQEIWQGAAEDLNEMDRLDLRNVDSFTGL